MDIEPRADPRRIGRRQFLAGALVLGGSELAVVLWTRLAPAPLVRGGGMPREVVSVQREVASDEQMSRS